MKQLILLLFFIFSLTLTAQSEGYNGNYEVKYKNNDGSIIEYKINLNSSGSFIFHYYAKHTRSKSPEQNIYGKGKWKADKNIISFIIDEQIDLDDTHILNFRNTKARIDRKSPRNKTPEIIPDLMRFFKSDISLVEGLKLKKIN